MACELETRDLDLFLDLYESRVMLTRQAAVSHFNGSADAAKQRIWKLKQEGYIKARPRITTAEPDVLFLGLKGYRALRERNQLPAHFPVLPENAFTKRAQVSDSTLAHELAVMQVKVALKAALKKHSGFELVQFGTWPWLHQFQAPRKGGGSSMLVQPDGYFSIAERLSPSEIATDDFFLEVDRSTEKLERLTDRVECYRTFYSTGGYAKRLGLKPENFKSAPFRVLILCKTKTRRNNLAVSLLRLSSPILTQVWLAGTAEFLANPLSNIWIKPQAYLTATRETQFDPKLPASWRFEAYPERDNFVENRIEKHPLVEIKKSDREGSLATAQPAPAATK